MAGSKEWLTPTEVAELLLVSPITVRQWAQRGLLEARQTAGGHRRFHIDAVRTFARKNGIALFGEDEVSKMLIVDDDRQLNAMLVELFHMHDEELKVESAFDGFEAGAKVQSMKPDVVLLDLMMPGLDGFEVCKKLKSNIETSHIRVVAMTGHYSPENKQRIMDAGADFFLRKPFTNDELFEACGLHQEQTGE